MQNSEKEKKKIENRLPVAWEGLPFIGIGLFFTILFLCLTLYSLAIILGILTLFTLYFFRDPDRGITVPENAVLTPADGKIIGIKRLSDNMNLLGEPAFKMSIFMSVFNVHVNRIPASGRIENIGYSPGKFFSAHLDKASHQNEHNKITLQTVNGHKIVFVQIAGLIARRIACWLKEEDDVKAGQRFGLIRFGSRLDIYLPINTRIIAQTSHRVKAGETVLGYLS